MSSVSSVKLESFMADMLFSPEILDRCESTIDEVMGGGIELGIEERFEPDGDGDLNMSICDRRKKAAKLQQFMNIKNKRKRKKDQKADERWKTYGHLPSQSTIRKYIGNSRKWKTTCNPEDLRGKTGGYCAMPCNLKKMQDICSLQEAVDLNFAVIECNNLYVFPFC
jgi:hypothetical protein